MSDYIKSKEYKLPDGSTVTAYFDELGIAKITIQAMDALFDILNSSDVVEVDKAQKEIDYWHDKAQSYEQTILKLSLNKADVVEVIRCKDCTYRKKNTFCLHNMRYEQDTGFCSYGKKRDD